MHPKVFQEFERICSGSDIHGIILEIGTTPDHQSLLSMKALQNAKEKIGIDINGPFEYNDITVVKGNANSMTCFGDNQFDVVLCNAMLEHDKYFWKTVIEIKRVCKPGGLVIIGVPGFAEFPAEEKIRPILAKIPLLKKLNRVTVTLPIHNHPGDFYRFSPQAMRDVLLKGMTDIHVLQIMVPPRIIGYGIKP